MKLYRNALILLAVLVVVAAGYFGVKAIVDKNNAEKGISGYTILDISSLDKVSKVTTEYEGDTITYAKDENGNWNTIAPSGLVADSYLSRAVALSLAPLKSTKLIEEKATDPALYGFDKPSRVTVELNDGKKLELLVGKKTDTGENYYVKTATSDRIYIVSNDVMARVLYKVYDIKAKELFTVNADNVTKLTMYVGGQKSYSGHKEGSYEWKLDFPLSSSVNLYLFMPVIDDIVALKVDKYITPKYENLSDYGLDTPRYEFVFESLGKTYHVQIGANAVKDESVYARFADSTEIFTLLTSDVAFLDKPVEQIMDNYIYVPTIEQINFVELLIDGADYKFDIVHDPANPRVNDVKATLNGTYDVSFKYKDQQWFKMMFLSLISVEVATTDLTYEPSGTPDVSIIYKHVADNVILRLDFYSKDDLYYAVTRNGVKTGLLVLKGQFSKEGGARQMLSYMKAQLGI